MHDTSEFARTGEDAVTDYEVRYVDRTLPGPETVREALATVDDALGPERLVRLCRVLYPVHRVRVAYTPPGDPGAVAGRADVLVDGLDAGHETDLASFAEKCASPVPVSLVGRYRLGTHAGPESVVPVEFERDKRAVRTEFAERLRETDAASAGRLRERYGLPDEFDPTGAFEIEDATRLYLPFWLAEFADDAGGRLVAFRDEKWTTGEATRRGAWLSEHVAGDERLLSRVRDVATLDRWRERRRPGQSGGSERAESRHPRDSDGTENPFRDALSSADSSADESADGPSTEAEASAGETEGESGRGTDDADDEITVPDDVELSVRSIVETNPDRDFADVGGMAELKTTLTELVVDPLEDPEKYERYGLGVTDGVLLYGPPGCGKTYVAGALAGELDRHFLSISPSDLTSKWVGEAADNVADVFEVARANAPCLVFIDEIDAVASDRSGDMTNTEQQMVNQLLAELEGSSDDDVVVLAATNLVEDVDDAVLRSGRFDERVEVAPPDAEAREAILGVHLDGRPTTDDLSLGETVARTEGYAASDVELVAERAARAALADEADIREDHLLAAAEEVETSIPAWLDEYDVAATGEADENGVRQPPGVSLDASDLLDAPPERDFAAVPGMAGPTTALRERVLDQLENPEQYADYGLDSPDGVLLYGPPECGKTYLSRAIAGELDRPYLRVTPTKLAVEWDGSPTENLADAFEVARANAPCVVFVDDLDALTPGAPAAADRALTHRLVAELAASPPDVFVVGATHLVEDVAASVRHAGCFGERVEVALPDADTREAVLRATLDDRLLGDVDWAAVVEASAGDTVGDLRLVAESAARSALREDEAVDTDRLRSTLATVGRSVEDWNERARYADSEYGSDLRTVR
ncbi:AAA family ATPase [Halorussus gelatinilyticus]|uniref:AAA family ATPase n=1 Tax=Halorussus gelatinilyticus TaxID=2937524 RepID=A0A8U0IDN1_9EURY|nr:AAA family ATPase [Halorussus gelatinilyticus]UPV99052.1 AAA family ATPase [Halorussus gelatinilyticus]